MADSSTLNVEVREDKGRRKVRRLRAEGKIPAVIYGDGKDSVSLVVRSDELDKAIRSGNRIVSLKGAESCNAFIKDVQWDTFGAHVLHVDFTHVQAGQGIEVTISLDIRGDAPGTHVGGQVEQPLQELVISCPPRSMTDHIEININELQLDQQITVGDLELPEGSTCEVDPSTVVVQCVEKQVELEGDEEVAGATGAEPEVIGSKSEDEDS